MFFGHETKHILRFIVKVHKDGAQANCKVPKLQKTVAIHKQQVYYKVMETLPAKSGFRR